MGKTGRNDPCPCGSGKKFKKCCELQWMRGQFKVTKVDSASGANIQKTISLSSLFQERLSHTPKKPSLENQSDSTQLESPRENPPTNDPLEKREDI